MTSFPLTRETEDSAAASLSPLLPVSGADLMVPTATGGLRRYVNLDYAASAPALQTVVDRVNEALPWYSSVHRGAGWASQVTTQMFESSRRAIATFLGARDDDVLVATRHTTDALNLLARCVPEDAGRVVTLDLEHHANLLPWHAGRHHVVGLEPTLSETMTALGKAMATERTALLAVTGASNVTGEELPLGPLVELARCHGARIAVDAAQLAPHRGISMRASDIDYLALSGHKLYAPFGSGVLVGRRDWLDRAQPYLAGGGAVVDVSLEGTEWALSPQRHEGGTPNVMGIFSLAIACRTLADLAAGALISHEAMLRERLVEGLADMPQVELHRMWPDAPSAIGVATFSVRGFDPGVVAAALSAEHAIGVRDGKFCAHPLLHRLGLPQGGLRASIGVGTSSSDIDRLLEALRDIVTVGPTLRYELVSGRHRPTVDFRKLPSWAQGLAGTQPSTAGTSPCQT